MPCSWEIKAQRRVGVVILHVENVHIAWALALRKLIIPGDIIPVTGMPYDMARNYGTQVALERGFSHVLHLDSDTCPPPEGVLRLLNHNLPIVSGVYYRRSPPHGIPVAIKRDKEGGNRWMTDLPQNSLVEVDMVGAGFLLFRRDVLEASPPQRPGKRWFDWRVDMAGTGVGDPKECMSEDFTLLTHIKRALGVSTYLDTGVMCRHIGFAEAVPGAMIPCQVIA